MPELQTVDLEEAQVFDPPHEGIGQSLDDEQNPWRARRRHARGRIEPSEGVGIFEAPRVRVHGSQEETLVRREVESNQHKRFSGVEGHQVDRRLPEDEARVYDPKAGLDALDVIGNKLLQVAEILDFQPLERRSHPSLSRTYGKQTVDQRPLCSTTNQNIGEFHRRPCQCHQDVIGSFLANSQI